MGAMTKKKSRAKEITSLAHGRPPTIKRPTATVSSQVTRRTIRSFHALNKRLARARADGDTPLSERLQQELDALGGLQRYQQASIQGQAADRGGDTSVVLMQWLRELDPHARHDDGGGDSSEHSKKLAAAAQTKTRPRMLEVGALSTRNACSRSGVFDMQRIDLHAQEEGIVQQDFMARPPPSSDEERFDVISLSLVLNFVPDAEGRGRMLERTRDFFRGSSSHDAGGKDAFPALFLVLPAPCTMNSRYFDEERLAAIMASLGYVLLRKKETAKLVYSLWHLGQRPPGKREGFGKMLLSEGRTRNNFCIVLR